MNIKDALNMANLRDTIVTKNKPEVVSAETLVSRLRRFDDSILAEAENFVSDEFILVEVEMDRVGCIGHYDKQKVKHLMAEGYSGPPQIVIDLNKKKIGKTQTGFAPTSIVVSGHEYFEGYARSRKTTVTAWVGMACKPFLRVTPHKPTTLHSGTPTVQRRNDFGGSTPSATLSGTIQSAMDMQACMGDKKCGPCEAKMNAGGAGSGRYPKGSGGSKSQHPFVSGMHKVLKKHGFNRGKLGTKGWTYTGPKDHYVRVDKETGSYNVFRSRDSGDDKRAGHGFGEKDLDTHLSNAAKKEQRSKSKKSSGIAKKRKIKADSVDYGETDTW